MDRALSFMERIYGYPRFRPGQEEILASVLEGPDTLVIMPTGGGKSLCYQVPAFIRDGVTLVISPLIALMKDQVDTLRVRDLPVAAIHSLMGLKEQEKVLHQIMSGEIKLVYASPERLRNRGFIQALMKNSVSMVAVDEAHCISQWGHDFRPDYLKISHALQLMGGPQTIALTATATEKVRSDIIEQLRLRTPKVFITGFDRRNLFWEVAPAQNDKEKLALIKNRVRDLSGAAIIYTGTRKKVEDLVTELRGSGFRAEAYHAGVEKADRNRVQDHFMEGRADLVVATNAFGMGIDRSDIRMVIHHTFPGSIEAYYQESGRAGRDGDPAVCLLLYAPFDRRLQEFFIDGRYPPHETVFQVYSRLLQRPEDPLWMTYHEIGTLGKERIPDLTVASCIKILEDAGALVRLQRYDNQAELYLHKPTQQLLGFPSQRARNRAKLIQGLERLYEDDQLTNGIQFLPEELAEVTGISMDGLRRCLSRMEADREATYIPPFRGRGLRLLERAEFEDLDIDFQALQVRKAYELERLDQVMTYATLEGCRRHYLLRYFGETITEERCGACDVCNRTRPDLGAEEADPILAVKVLSGVARLKGRFGLGMAAKVLTGSEEKMILQFRLDRLSTYGLLSECAQTEVQGWIRELIAKGCILSRRIAIGEKNYPVLQLTDRGRRVMAGGEEVRLTLTLKGLTHAIKKAPASHKGSEREIYEKLRELRTDLARKEKIPSYCIFQDRTLREMARVLPSTPDALLCIVGVGEVTLKKYGGPFLKLLRSITE